MLLYLCIFQTGPKMGEFKVQDFDKYEFKPAKLVSEICEIYVNLSDSNQFLRAVSADGRSYSPSLFNMAETTLIKIRTPSAKIQQFMELGANIQV